MHRSPAAYSRPMPLALFFLGLAVLLGPVLPGCVLPALAQETFSFAAVEEMAKALAAKPHQPAEAVPKPLLALNYDDWRKIRFKTADSLWRPEKLPFELQFFPPGFLYTRAVKVNVVADGKAEPLSLPTDMFDFSQIAGLREQLPDSMGMAGFRVHTAMATTSYLDEFLVFLGASYFRAVAKGQGYGLSARGLAVNTALQEGEEFPVFREFWIERPAKNDKWLTIHALLDSESLTGAYTFRALPGDETVIEVTSRIFPRKPVKKLGIAPLTSMFFYGENSSPSQRIDWRPEVHDSDGLQIHFRSGEWLWRPLHNPGLLQVNTFEADNLLQFGLMQRDTDFRSYQDLESRFENRPSVLIEPAGEWGQGSVELVLIPSEKEIHDNVVAYWVPKEPMGPGKPLAFDYRMRWLSAPAAAPPQAAAVSTRVGRPDPNSRLFVLDFANPPSGKSPAEGEALGMVSAGPGAKITEQQAYRNPATGGWRLSFKVAVEAKALATVLPEKRAPIELRAFLKFPDGTVSETWSYAVTPEK